MTHTTEERPSSYTDENVTRLETRNPMSKRYGGKSERLRFSWDVEHGSPLKSQILEFHEMEVRMKPTYLTPWYFVGLCRTQFVLYFGFRVDGTEWDVPLGTKWGTVSLTDFCDWIQPFNRET